MSSKDKEHPLLELDVPVVPKAELEEGSLFVAADVIGELHSPSGVYGTSRGDIPLLRNSASYNSFYQGKSKYNLSAYNAAAHEDWILNEELATSDEESLSYVSETTGGCLHEQSLVDEDELPQITDSLSIGPHQQHDGLSSNDLENPESSPYIHHVQPAYESRKHTVCDCRCDECITPCSCLLYHVSNNHTDVEGHGSIATLLPSASFVSVKQRLESKRGTYRSLPQRTTTGELPILPLEPHSSLPHSSSSSGQLHAITPALLPDDGLGPSFSSLSLYTTTSQRRLPPIVPYSNVIFHHHHSATHVYIPDSTDKSTDKEDLTIMYTSTKPILPANPISPPLKPSFTIFIATVGLPARGKSYIASQQHKYLTWLRYSCELVSLSSEAVSQSLQPYKTNLEKSYYQAQLDVEVYKMQRRVISALQKAVKIIIIDSSSVNVINRNVLRDFCSRQHIPYNIMWLETFIDDKEIVQAHVDQIARFDHRYQKLEYETAVSTINDQIQRMQTHYVSVSDEEVKGKKNECYFRLENGTSTVSYNVRGFLPTKVSMFLQNVSVGRRNTIFLSRHGQSLANTTNQVGTDAPLSIDGQAYADALAKWLQAHPALQEGKEVHIYCSTLQRTIVTASSVNDQQSQNHRTRMIKWRSQEEINAGIYDGWTYSEIDTYDPQGSKLRAHDKQNYQYPQGESYKDVIDRIEKVILELLRCPCPVIVIAHQAVIRCLYGFQKGVDMVQVPHLHVPLHHVITVEDRVTGLYDETIDIMQWAHQQNK